MSFTSDSRNKVRFYYVELCGTDGVWDIVNPDDPYGHLWAPEHLEQAKDEARSFAAKSRIVMAFDDFSEDFDGVLDGEVVWSSEVKDETTKQTI